MKKSEPKTPSFIENGATLYSYPWMTVNIPPYTIVANNPLIVVVLSPAKMARCAQVTVTPDDNKIKVFHNGNPQGSNAIIPCGGHTQPIPTEGAKAQ
jgi:hypothetical protein